MMESTLVHLYFTLILIFTICLSLEQCKAHDEVHPFEKFCDQPIDCGHNHVIAVFQVNQKKAFRVLVKNKCNGQHKCEIDKRDDKGCRIKYYCISDRFTHNCIDMKIPESIEKSSDIYWCYRYTKQTKGDHNCWEFSEGLNHHWIILRGIMKIKMNDSDTDGTPMTNFDLIRSYNKSEVCTSSKYIWIIYIGTKSPKTPVNIYSKVDPAILMVDPTDPRVDPTTPRFDPTVPRVDLETIKFDTTVNQGEKDVNKNSSVVDQNKNITKVLPNGSAEKIILDHYLFKDIKLTEIIIIIAAIGGVLIVLVIFIAILWYCCKRCNKVTISVPEQRKDSYMEKDAKSENPDCQIRENFIPAEGIRDTFDSVGFWSDDEDYNPEVGDRNSKVTANIYAMSDCLYGRKHSKSEIYMNTGVPPPPRYGNEKDVYINMNAKPINKHFNVFL